MVEAIEFIKELQARITELEQVIVALQRGYVNLVIENEQLKQEVEAC